MAHQTFTLQPGVQIVETPALNTAGISECNLIRFKPDTKQGGLVEKLGGWSKFYPIPFFAAPRSIHPWADTNAAKWVAVGQTQTPPAGAFLVVLTCVTDANGRTTASSRQDLSPAYQTTNNAVSTVTAFSTTAGSPLVTITDNSAASNKVGSSVYIPTHVAIGGIVLFGLYGIVQAIGTNKLVITSVDALGQPLPALTTTTTATMPVFTSTSGSNTVSVNLTAHGFNVGDTFPVVTPLTFNGLTLQGNYLVTSITPPDNFTIEAHMPATASGTATLNGGNVRLIYALRAPPPATSQGYGIGGYGLGGYGTGQVITTPGGATASATDWTLDNWGEILMACPAEGTVVGTGLPFSPIFQWSPTSSDPIAVAIPESPPVNDGFFVAMPQRQIVAWGSSFDGVQDPLLIRWCDANNFHAWLGTVVNQAGSYRIPRGSKVVGGLQGPQQGIIWTNLAVWSMQYNNQPYIYAFNELANGCGLIARKAAVVMADTVYWMGNAQFFMMAGAGVTPIPCPVWDYVFQQIDRGNVNKVRCAANSQFGEITWFFPIKGGNGEATNYVKYNVFLQVWDYGQLERSAWHDQSVVGPPIGASATTSYIYQHEIGTDADDNQPMNSWFRSGYFVLSDADQKMFVDEIWPDMKWGYNGGQQSATINLNFRTRDYPSQTPIVNGPFTLTVNSTYINARCRARLMQVEVGSNDVGTWWRIGGMRYRGAPDGRY